MVDLVVIGAGPSGLMTALQAAKQSPTKRILLLEACEKAGQKLLATGGGRCNIFNAENPDRLADRYYEASRFMKAVFSRYDSSHLRSFFDDAGFKLTVEEKGRVFPESNTAKSVLAFFLNALEEAKVELLLNHKVLSIEKKEEGFALQLEKFSEALGCSSLMTKKLVLACGSNTYPQLCGTESAPLFAESLGLGFAPFSPALSAIHIEEEEAKLLAGMSLQEVSLQYVQGKKKASFTGDLLFTHKGFSGPVAQNLSHFVYAEEAWASKEKIELFLDLYTPTEREQPIFKERYTLLENYALSDVQKKEKILSFFPQHCPEKLKKYLLQRLFTSEKSEWGEVSKKEARNFSEFMRKGLRFAPHQQGNMLGRPSLSQSKVAKGGILLKEIEASSMQSKAIAGLYVVGEALDLDGQSGGYNLQACFSTGSVAGRHVFLEETKKE